VGGVPPGLHHREDHRRPEEQCDALCQEEHCFRVVRCPRADSNVVPI
jgi:hypothetical protein